MMSLLFSSHWARKRGMSCSVRALRGFFNVEGASLCEACALVDASSTVVRAAASHSFAGLMARATFVDDLCRTTDFPPP